MEQLGFSGINIRHSETDYDTGHEVKIDFRWGNDYMDGEVILRIILKRIELWIWSKDL
jgi:hypothetical protein